jgi:hypothetical protein
MEKGPQYTKNLGYANQGGRKIRENYQLTPLSG